MLMIIAPSKTQKADPSLAAATTTQPQLLHESELLIAELRGKSVAELAKLMKMSDTLAQKTWQRIQDFTTPFTGDNADPAIGLFQGDVYSRIAVADYGEEEGEYLQEHLRILSGLYGVLRPFDLIQPYRLEMGCRLQNSRGKNLYEFWDGRITELMNQALVNQPDPVVVNLASAEYSRVLKKGVLAVPVLEVDFKERKGDGYRVVAIHAKRARGMMVDFAVRHRVERWEELRGFGEDGYCFREEFSGEGRICFTRG